MIDIIFFDFDNTLYSHSLSGFPKNSLKALRKLQEKGIKTFLCTGGAPIELEYFDLRGLVLDGKIMSSGQVAISNDGVIYEKTVEGPLRDTLIRIFNEMKYPIYFCTPDDMIMNFCNDTVRRVQNAISSQIPNVKPYNNEKIYMASAFFDK